MENNQIKDNELRFNYRYKAGIIFEKIKGELMEDNLDYSNALFKIIDEIVLDKEKHQFIQEIPCGTILYRAREIKIEEYNKNGTGLNLKHENDLVITEGFNEKNSIECPIGIGKDGRNNIAGASYLYVAEDVATACAEIKSPLRSFISVAEFETKEPLKIIDFTTEKSFDIGLNEQYKLSIAKFITYIMMEFCQPVANEKDYKTTQIISDYIRKTGYDGIVYRSFFTSKNNYTIFNCHKSKISFLKSRIVAHQFVDNVFWDFNNQSAIHTDEQNNKEYDSKTADSILRSMLLTFDDKEDKK